MLCRKEIFLMRFYYQRFTEEKIYRAVCVIWNYPAYRNFFQHIQYLFWDMMEVVSLRLFWDIQFWICTKFNDTGPDFIVQRRKRAGCMILEGLCWWNLIHEYLRFAFILPKVVSKCLDGEQYLREFYAYCYNSEVKET